MQAKTVIMDHIVFKDGEARIAGKEHLKAELVARMHVNGERDIEYVMEHYGLTRAQVHAALSYFYDNQETLDAAYEQSYAEGRRRGSIDAEELEARIRARMENR